jgi:uncharacterized membrane protein
MNTFFLSVRVVHILFGAIWLGAAFFMSFLLMPALREAGPDGSKVVQGLGRRRIHVFIASISGITVLTGLWLYWRFTGGFNPADSASMGGRVFGAGGVLGLVAAVIAGSVVGRNMKRVVALLAQMDRTEAAGRAALMDQLLHHRQKAASGARIVAVLLIVTIVLMAIGHYV